MMPRTEFDIVGPAAELTEQRLSRCDSAAIVAVTHKLLTKASAFLVRWA
jgi:hypothetical protein